MIERKAELLNHLLNEKVIQVIDDLYLSTISKGNWHIMSKIMAFDFFGIQFAKIGYNYEQHVLFHM